MLEIAVAVIPFMPLALVSFAIAHNWIYSVQFTQIGTHELAKVRFLSGRKHTYYREYCSWRSLKTGKYAIAFDLETRLSARRGAHRKQQAIVSTELRMLDEALRE